MLWPVFLFVSTKYNCFGRVINFDVLGNHSTLKYCPHCNGAWHLGEFATKAQLVDSLKTNKTYFSSDVHVLHFGDSKSSQTPKRK